MGILSHDTIVAGHRGMPLEYPDNTLAGFRAAAEVVPMVELDVRRTADDRLVLAHDPHLRGLVVAETDWAGLRSLDVGDGHHPALLDDVLESLPALRLDIEVKNSPLEPGFEPDHRTALEVADLARPIDVITSFYWPTVDAVKAARPDIATGILVDQAGSMAEATRYAAGMGHEVIAPHYALVTEVDVQQARAVGVAVATWTLNDPDTAIAFASWGVSTIITDDIHRISAALEGR